LSPLWREGDFLRLSLDSSLLATALAYRREILFFRTDR
jgi:hypothetical protein